MIMTMTVLMTTMMPMMRMVMMMMTMMTMMMMMMFFVVLTALVSKQLSCGAGHGIALYTNADSKAPHLTTLGSNLFPARLLTQ